MAVVLYSAWGHRLQQYPGRHWEARSNSYFFQSLGFHNRYPHLFLPSHTLRHLQQDLNTEHTAYMIREE